MLYKEKITQSQQYNNKGRKGETTIDVLVGWALENPWNIGHLKPGSKNNSNINNK